MSQSSLTDILSQVAEGTAGSRINISLSNGNRVSLANWELAGDCLVERWPNGSPRYLVPVAQIIVVEILDQE